MSVGEGKKLAEMVCDPTGNLYPEGIRKRVDGASHALKWKVICIITV
jgi:hypothetical protein